MKKAILFLLVLISIYAVSQSPQRFNKVIVTGDITSPKFIRTGSTIDSVLLGNGSARSVNSIKTDTTHLSARINLKQDALISGTNIRTVNGNSVLGSGDIQISSGGGGGGVNVYLSNTASSVSGYNTSTLMLDASETSKTITTSVNGTIAWGEKYLYTSPVATTLLPSGFWSLHLFGSINSNTGVTQVVFRIFKYNGSTETTLYTITGYETNQTSDGEIIVESGVLESAVLSTDYIGFQIGVVTNSTPKTLTYTLGDGHATYTTNPLPLRHSALRDKNGESDFQHLTAAQVSVVNSTSNINTGDETLTSIKTKLGAATSASDGYLKYQDWGRFDGKQNALTFGDLSSNASGVSVSGGTGAVVGSGVTIGVTNAGPSTDGMLLSTDWVTFHNKQTPLSGTGFVKISGTTIAYDNSNYEPSFSKNTAFNKNFGTTAGTVLEGRTFGTAANSAITDFAPSSNVSFPGFGLTTGKSWGYDSHPTTISGYGIVDIPTYSGSNFILNQNTSAQNANMWISGIIQSGTNYISGMNVNNLSPGLYINNTSGHQIGLLSGIYQEDEVGFSIRDISSSIDLLKIYSDNSATFSSTVKSTGFIKSGGASSQFLKADGSVDGNSYQPTLVSGTNIKTINSTSLMGSGNVTIQVPGILDTDNSSAMSTSDGESFASVISLHKISKTGNYNDLSNKPTILTSSNVIQNQNAVAQTANFDINGTGRALGFDAEVISANGISVTATKIVVNGSTSGSVEMTQPFNGDTYKKVIFYLNSLTGSASFTFPQSFDHVPAIIETSSVISSTAQFLTTTGVTIYSNSGISGFLILEGY